MHKRTARVTTRVVTRHSSPTPHFYQGCDPTRVQSSYISHILYIVVRKPRQRAVFSIPVKSVSLKSFDYTRHRACAIARPVSQLEHINVYPERCRDFTVWTSIHFSIKADAVIYN